MLYKLSVVQTLDSMLGPLDTLDVYTLLHHFIQRAGGGGGGGGGGKMCIHS